MTPVQVRRRSYALLIAFAAAMCVGMLIELEEGATGTGESPALAASITAWRISTVR